MARPFTAETAARRVRAAEDAWNTRDPARVALAYTEDSVWRNRDEFGAGRDQIRAFLAGRWEREHDYRLAKALWALVTPARRNPLPRQCRREDLNLHGHG
jgi:nuclear transport factor 2 (NTF2) superfamily protein